MNDNRLTDNIKKQTYAKFLLDSVYAYGGIKDIIKCRNNILEIITALTSNYSSYEKLLSYNQEAAYSKDAKAKLVEHTNGVLNGAHKCVVDLVDALIENNDLYLLIDLFDAYNLAFEKKFNKVIVDVTTVVELDDELRTLIKNKVKQDLGYDCILDETISDDIIGGVVIKVKNRMLDCSFSNILKRASIKLKEF